MEERTILADQLRKHPTSDFICFAGKVENIIHFAMAVHINTIVYFTSLLDFLKSILDLVDLRMYLLYRMSPSPVEVKSTEIASAIAVNYAIHIDHRVDSELVVP